MTIIDQKTQCRKCKKELKEYYNWAYIRLFPKPETILCPDCWDMEK